MFLIDLSSQYMDLERYVGSGDEVTNKADKARTFPSEGDCKRYMQVKFPYIRYELKEINNGSTN